MGEEECTYVNGGCTLENWGEAWSITLGDEEMDVDEEFICVMNEDYMDGQMEMPDELMASQNKPMEYRGVTYGDGK